MSRVYQTEFFVEGLPAPKGSPQVVTKVRVKGGGWRDLAFPRVCLDNASTKNWAKTVEMYARAHFKGDALDGPVGVEITFFLPRTKEATKKKLVHQSKKPDIDKLARTTLDALEAAGIFTNDSRVAELYLTKKYEREDQFPGALIRTWDLNWRG